MRIVLRCAACAGDSMSPRVWLRYFCFGISGTFSSSVNCLFVNIVVPPHDVFLFHVAMNLVI